MATILTDPSKGIFGGYTTITQRPIPRPSIGGGIAPGAESALQRAMAYYQEGGGYGKGVEAGLGRARTKTMAAGMQSLVSAGLAGTTMAAGLGKKFEEEVGMPARARVEETRAGAISGLEAMKAQIIQGATESARSRALQEYLARLQTSQQGYQSAIQAALAGQVQSGGAGGAGAGPAMGGAGAGADFRSLTFAGTGDAGDAGGGYSPASIAWQQTQEEARERSRLARLGADMGAGPGSEEEYQTWLSPKLAGGSAYEKEYAERPTELPQYQAGYAAWRKWKGYVD